MKWLFVFFFLFSNSLWAQTLRDKNRISPSYSSAISCFPVLKSSDLEKNFSLKNLKEKMDQTFPSASSEETSKIWVVKDANQNRTRVTLKSTGTSQKPAKILTVEKLDAHDIGENTEIPASHKFDPSQKIINTYLHKNTILREETERIDTRLNGLKSRLQQNGNEILALDLWDSRLAQRLNCEAKERLGVICLCEKK